MTLPVQAPTLDVMNTGGDGSKVRLRWTPVTPAPDGYRYFTAATDAALITDEVTSITSGGTAGGSFTVTANSITSAAIRYNATAAEMQAILDTAFGAGNLVNALHAGANFVETITLGAGTTGGTFTITFNGHVTGAITWTGTPATDAATILAALIAASGSSIIAGDVTVSIVGLVITITATAAGLWALQPIPTTTANGGSLTGGAATATPAVGTAGVRATYYVTYAGAYAFMDFDLSTTPTTCTAAAAQVTEGNLPVAAGQTAQIVSAAVTHNTLAYFMVCAYTTADGNGPMSNHVHITPTAGADSETYSSKYHA